MNRFSLSATLWIATCGLLIYADHYGNPGMQAVAIDLLKFFTGAVVFALATK